MTLIADNPNPNAQLTEESFDAAGMPQGLDAEVTLVVGAKREAQDWLRSKQWTLLWRDADILYQSPRPLSTWENTYIQEPNVTRYTVLKLTNALSSTMSKGLFYEDPPMLLRPLAGTSPDVTQWKLAVMGYFLKQMEFKREMNLGLDQFNLLGTTVCKLTVGKKKINVPKRKASVKMVDSGGKQERVIIDEEPNITDQEKVVTNLTFEMLDIAGDVMEGNGGDVLVDPKCAVPDIRCAGWVIHRGFVDYYDLQALALDPEYDLAAKDEKGKVKLDDEGNVEFVPDVMSWFFTPAETDNTPSVSDAQSQVVHHAQAPTALTSNPLNAKLEILEYLNQKTGQVITVLNERLVIRKGDAKGKIRYFSANCWNRRKAWLGIGAGLVAGQDQRLEQGATNSALKVLNMNLNTGYAMEQGGGQPTGMIRTGLGKIWTIADITKMPKLLETVKVDPSIWAVLQDSRAQSEASTGADQTLVQGSSAGPRTSMGRTAGGAGRLANASATRLEGPMERVINQIFVPVLYALDEIIYRYVSDQELLDILGEKLGKAAADSVDMQAYHDGKYEFDVLAGAGLAAKQTMAQSLVILGQYIMNPELQQFLADVHGVYIDQLEFFKMLLTASEWGQGVEQSLIKKLTAEMEKRRAQQKQDPKLATAMTLAQQKQEADSQLEDQKTQNRITRDITVDSFRQAGEAEAVTGAPGGPGFGAPEEGVEA